MEQLFSPWRSQFIDSMADSSSESGESPFTVALRDPEHDAENHLLHRGDLAFIILNKYPYNAGHLLILPKRQTGDYLDLTAEERAELGELVAFGIAILKRALDPHAFNVGMNLGRVAGAGIESHVHFHIVPRWTGDTNFMPLFSETRVISHGMEETYQKLLVARDQLLHENRA